MQAARVIEYDDVDDPGSPSLDQVIQSGDPDMVMHLRDPAPRSALALAGQVVLSFFLAWMEPKTLD